MTMKNIVKISKSISLGIFYTSVGLGTIALLMCGMIAVAYILQFIPFDGGLYFILAIFIIAISYTMGKDLWKRWKKL